MFTLNLNQYRNAHYHVLNKAKVNYKEIIKGKLPDIKLKTPILIIYTLYPKTRRLTDIGNVCCVHQKFFEDALTEHGLIEDDNYLFINTTVFRFGKVDKLNPRVSIEIRTIT